jgi:hypothetical protein
LIAGGGYDVAAALNNLALAQRESAKAQMDFLNMRLPRNIETQRTSQVVTPASRGQSSSSHIPLVEELEDTEWPLYEPRHVEKDYYFNLLIPHFENVNGKERYRLIKSKDHYWVKDEGEKKTLLRCARQIHNGRNLYLELFANGYHVLEWINARAEMGLEYINLTTPPSYR